MKSNKQIIGLLKAIFFLAVSIAMILIGYVISGGETNAVCRKKKFFAVECPFLPVLFVTTS